jgi:hypothetical protein
VRCEDNVFKTDSAEGGMCGGVTIETLHKTDNTDFWAYEMQRAYFDRRGSTCSKMPEKVTMKFNWRAPTSFIGNCTTLTFGFDR